MSVTKTPKSIVTVIAVVVPYWPENKPRIEAWILAEVDILNKKYLRSYCFESKEEAKKAAVNRNRALRRFARENVINL